MTGAGEATAVAAYLPSCAGCQFWDQHQGHLGRTGCCRRHAPRIIDKLVIPTAEDDSDDGFEQATAWPATFDGDWCGEWCERAVQP